MPSRIATPPPPCGKAYSCAYGAAGTWCMHPVPCMRRAGAVHAPCVQQTRGLTRARRTEMHHVLCDARCSARWGAAYYGTITVLRHHHCITALSLYYGTITIEYYGTITIEYYGTITIEYYGTRRLERDDVNPPCAQRLHRGLGRRRPLPLDVAMRAHGGLLHLARRRLRL